jgi:hypothetical protein
MNRNTAKNLINGTFAVALVGIGLTVGISIGKYEAPTTTSCPHCDEQIIILADNSIYTPPKTETITVKEGDKLWHICADFCPKDMDIREYIGKIEALNGINADIQAGQKIKMIIE